MCIRDRVKLAPEQTPPAFLREDMTLSVEVLTGERARALVLPPSALPNTNPTSTNRTRMMPPTSARGPGNRRRTSARGGPRPGPAGPARRPRAAGPRGTRRGPPRVRARPTRWAINPGGQCHRWFGNGYCQARGAELIAHAAAVPDMRSRGGDRLSALRTLLGPAAEATVPTLPERLLEGPDARLELGATVFEFRHRGGGPTPGDMEVWRPQAQLAFAGDIVYVDRLPAVLPVSSTRAWLDAFAALEQLAPKHIVPGHGRVTDLAAARAQTRAYLEALRVHMKRAVDQGIDVSDAVKSFNAAPFLHLASAAELNPGNASRTYFEVERE